MFAGKNLRMTQKIYTRWFHQKNLKIDAYAAAKCKIILLWPNVFFSFFCLNIQFFLCKMEY